MTFDSVTGLLIFLIRHATVFELPVVILCAAAGSYILSLELAKHNARLRETKFSRRVAAFYVAVFIVTSLVHYLI